MTTLFNQAPTPNATNPRSFYDSHTLFEGYINRATLITPKTKHGKSYWSVSISMLSGSKDNPVKTTVDTVVRGGEAERLIKEHAQGVGKVAIYGQFKVSDIASKSYVNKDNEVIHALTGRLILITYLKVGKDTVYCSPDLKDYVPHTHYDVHTTFAGFINRAVLKMSEKGRPYWSVDICMLSGATDDPTKITVNTAVRGGEIETLIEKHASVLADTNDKVAIFGSFKLLNISPNSYVNKKSDTVYVLQGRLIGINYLKVGKDVVKQSTSASAISQIKAILSPQTAAGSLCVA